MDRELARNIAILLLLAALVAFAPGAGITTEVANTLVNGAIMAVLVFALGIFYRRHQSDLWALGDPYRGLLYGAIGLVVVLMTARYRLSDTTAGTIVLLAGFGAVAGAVWVLVVRLREVR